MPTDITALVKSIPDNQPSTVTLTHLAGKKEQLSCIFKQASPPSFFLLFPPDSLPEAVDTKRLCAFVSRDMHGDNVSFAAEIIEIPNNRVVELVARKAIRPEDLREYFRVNLRTMVEVFCDPGKDESRELPFELQGETVDISQTGVLTILPDECRVQKPVMIELDLPNPAETVICSGQVIRSKRIRNNRWLTAFHFVNISARTRDIIAKNCFAEQRRQLRENIQTEEY